MNNVVKMNRSAASGAPATASARVKQVVHALKTDPKCKNKAILALNLLADDSLAGIPASGIITMLRATGTSPASPSGSSASSSAGWAKAAAAANAAHGL